MVVKTYDEYQKTELPWLTKVPSHWTWLRNKNIYAEKKEIVGDRKTEFKLLSLTKKGIIIRDVSSGKGKFPKDFDTYKVVNPGDMVFCLFDVDETPRTVGLSNYRGMITGAYDVFGIHGINSKYAYYYYLAFDNLKAYKPLYSGLRKTIPLPSFMATKIPVPPKEEQDQIVKYLDWKTAEIDRFVHQKKKQIKKLEEYKFTKIDELITKGMNSHVQMEESGVEWLGQIPEHWDVHTIKQHFKVRKRIAGKEGYDVLSITQQGLKVKDISSNEGQMAMDYSGYQFVNPGDFAMNHMDLITGYVDLSDKFGVTSPDYRVFTLEDTDNCYPEFYLRVFQVAYKRRIFYKFGKGAANQGRWRLPQRAFYNFSIQIPPIEEQKAIEMECKRLEKNVDEMIDALKKEIDLLQELRTKIIADVVTGQIDVRDVVIPEYSRDIDTDSDDIEDDEEIEESED